MQYLLPSQLFFELNSNHFITVVMAMHKNCFKIFICLLQGSSMLELQIAIKCRDDDFSIMLERGDIYGGVVYFRKASNSQ